MHTFLSHLSAEEPFTFLGEGLSIVEAITFLNQSAAKPENHNLEMFTIHMYDIFMQGPNVLGPKFLGAQISCLGDQIPWGPKKSGAQMRLGTISVIVLFLWHE